MPAILQLEKILTGDSAANVEDPPPGSFPPFSPFPPRGNTLDAGIYPANSWLARYMDFARNREESADSYLLGAVLPVFAASLARNVSFPWGECCIYTNLFAMLAGKPGDRKSSAINLAEKVARSVLNKNRFLPASLSVEALFNEYDSGQAGSPDKLLVADDGNPFIGLLTKSNYGERVGDLLLPLYDCKGLSEAFLRNKSGNTTSHRFIPETSTCIILGATFNVCQFKGQEIRSGLQRRFTYYLAERHGRFISHPPKCDLKVFQAVCHPLEEMAKLVETSRVEFQFAPGAAELWDRFQKRNRQQLDSTSVRQESQLARLNGQPIHALKLAMIFQCALWAENRSKPLTGLIEADTLTTAIEHSEHCIVAAQALDAIGNRAAIEDDADVLLANIEHAFRHKANNGEIALTRTELTRTFANHSARRDAWKPDDLYLRLIPDLIRRRMAREVPRAGKPSAYAFTLQP